jgi:tRNA(fMet)-specific endonuclease VapC
MWWNWRAKRRSAGVGISVTRGYLLDTNQLGHAVTTGSTVRRQIAALRAAGARVGTCVPVLCELEVGIQQVKDPDHYRKGLEGLLRQIRVWPLDLTTCRIFGEIYNDLKRRGRVLSQVDIMRAALATHMQLALVTSDQDFAALPGLRTENWLTAPGRP